MFGLSIGTTIKLILACLKFLNSIIKYLDDKKMLDAGAKQQMAKETAEINDTLGFVDQIVEKTKTKTDEELDKILGGEK